MLLYLFFAGISTESCSIFNEFVIQKTPVWSKNHTGVQLVKNNAEVLGASRVSHGVIAGELLVGVRAGVLVAEEGEVRRHAQRHERVGKDDDGDVAGHDLALQAADLDDEDERRRHEADHDGVDLLEPAGHVRAPGLDLGHGALGR